MLLPTFYHKEREADRILMYNNNISIWQCNIMKIKQEREENEN